MVCTLFVLKYYICAIYHRNIKDILSDVGLGVILQGDIVAMGFLLFDLRRLVEWLIAVYFKASRWFGQLDSP